MPTSISTNIKQPFLSPIGTPLAIDPKAYGEDFLCLEMTSLAPDDTDPAMSVVHVDGPINYASSLFWQSYDSIRAQVVAACALPAPVVVMRINSPGGDVHGAFDCARDLRKICDAAGKRWIVHVEAQCCSAGYALASTAHEIAVSATAQIGSIGVIAQYVTATEAAAKEGLRHTTISSGAYKADGNPMTAIDDPMRARLQALIDAAAGEFFLLVAEGRGLSIDAIRDLQAGCFLGHDAVAKGLADAVVPWSDFRTRIAKGGTIHLTTPSASNALGADSMSDRDDIRARLTKQCESEDPVESARAKKALAAYDESDPDKGDDEGDKEAKAADEKPEAKAADDKPEAKAADEKPEPEATTAAMSALVSKVQALEAKAAADSAKAEKADRAALYASRPDISGDLRKTLDGLPVAQAKAVLAGVPVAGRAISAGANLPRATQGASGNGLDLSTPELRAAAAASLPADIRAGMGLHKFNPGQTFEVGNRLYFGQPPSEESV